MTAKICSSVCQALFMGLDRYAPLWELTEPPTISPSQMAMSGTADKSLRVCADSGPKPAWSSVVIIRKSI